MADERAGAASKRVRRVFEEAGPLRLTATALLLLLALLVGRYSWQVPLLDDAERAFRRALALDATDPRAKANLDELVELRKKSPTR